MEEELGKQLLIRGTKGSRKVTLTEEGMILRKRAEEILDLVKKTKREVTLSNHVIMGDIYIGTRETDAAFVTERLDKGLLDFGIVFLGVMQKDSSLAQKETIAPKDL